jgi:hypothetical protein
MSRTHAIDGRPSEPQRREERSAAEPQPKRQKKDRIMQKEEKPEPMRMILCGHDSVFRSYCGPADFLAAREQL